jgi:hypothetical protein
MSEDETKADKPSSKVEEKRSKSTHLPKDWLDDQRIIARGPDAQRLAKQYRETLRRHSRLNPDNTPSAWTRVALIAFVVLLFWYAIQGRMQVIEWKRMLQTLNGEKWDMDYTNLERLSPMDDRVLAATAPRHAEF